MTSHRWSLTLAYVLATLVAPGLHDHGESGHHAPATLADCSEGGVHLAAHTDAPDLSHGVDDCPACQIRAAQGVAVPGARVALLGGGTSPPHYNVPCRITSPRVSPPSRAPPRA